MKKYLVSYRFGDFTWGLSIDAESIADAECRLEAIGGGWVDGALLESIPWEWEETIDWKWKH